jgi:hypothetical protein
VNARRQGSSWTRIPDLFGGRRPQHQPDPPPTSTTAETSSVRPDRLQRPADDFSPGSTPATGELIDNLKHPGARGPKGWVMNAAYSIIERGRSWGRDQERVPTPVPPPCSTPHPLGVVRRGRSSILSPSTPPFPRSSGWAAARTGGGLSSFLPRTRATSNVRSRDRHPLPQEQRRRTRKIPDCSDAYGTMHDHLTTNYGYSEYRVRRAGLTFIPHRGCT